MKKLVTMVMVIVGMLPAVASAGALSVTFVPDPLFRNTSALPGDVASERYIEIQNTSPRDIGPFFGVTINNDPSRLVDFIEIFVRGGTDDVLWSGNMAELATQPVALGVVRGGKAVRYDIQATVGGLGNNHQNAKLMFDVWVAYYDRGLQVIMDSGSGGTPLLPSVLPQSISEPTIEETSQPGLLGQVLGVFMGGDDLEKKVPAQAEPAPAGSKQEGDFVLGLGADTASNVTRDNSQAPDRQVTIVRGLVGSDWQRNCVDLLIFILLVLLLLVLVWDTWFHDKEGKTTRSLWRARATFLAFMTLCALLTLWILSKHCSTVPLATLTILFVLLRYYVRPKP